MIAYILLVSISVSARYQDCFSDILLLSTRLLNFTGTDEFSRMAQYSGRKINDLGDYRKCIDLEHSEYVLFKLIPMAEIFIGICGPSSCEIQDYELILDTVSNFSSQVIPVEILRRSDKITQYTLKSNRKVTHSGIEIIYPYNYFSGLSTAAIILLSVWSVLALLAVIGTFTDILMLKQQQALSTNQYIAYKEMLQPSETYVSIQSSSSRSSSSILKYLRCFSLYTNIQKLLTSRSLERTGAFENLDILNSVRVISLCWIIFGHVYMLRAFYTALANPEDALDWIKEVQGVLVYGAFYAVDVFFWLSGFLMGYIFLLEYDRKDKMMWNKLYLHRFYRILPTYAIVLFSTWKLIKFMGDGPIWYRADAINMHCEDYWWTNLVFLNNFVPNGDGNQCMAWGWYLANDMQFFILAPFVLYIYHRMSKIVGWSIFLSLILTDILSNAIISSINNFEVGGFKSEGKNNKMYIKPYCRIAPYAIGMLFGLIYFTHRKYQTDHIIYDNISYSILKLFHSRYVRYLFYLIGLGLISFMIFMEYPAYSSAAKSESLEDDWNQSSRSAFMAFNRSGFVLGVSLIVLPLLMGYNKAVGNVMRSRVWTPLARLSFCGYLVHISVLAMIYGRQEVAYYLTSFNLLTDFVVGCVGTYAIAFLIFILVECPMINVEKVVRD